VVPKQSEVADPKLRIDLTTALQYGTAEGYPALASFLRQFTRDHLHPNVPYAGGPEILLTCGNTDGLSKAVELFTNVWNPSRDWIQQREGILCEEFAYMNAIQTVRPRGLNVTSVIMDGQGMCASGKGGLADVLENWDFRRGRRPHLMYTVTIGQNPTGGTLSVERRKEIYALCQKYDVIIVEDEPYWNLQFPSAYEKEARHRSSSHAPGPGARNYNENGKSSGYEFLDSLVPSYLSIDTEGRVVRLDTFSKTVAPGSRLGWMTAQPAVIERLTRITETSTQQPSGFVQALVAEMIMGKQDGSSGARVSKKEDGQGWHMDGWVRWLEGLRGGYERRMTAMCDILEESKYILSQQSESHPSDHADNWEVVDRIQMFDFVWPKAGMFVWLSLFFDNHPLRSQYSPERLSRAFWVHLTRKPHLCLIGPGSMFATTEKSVAEAHKYFRIAFAPMDAEDVVPFTRRLVEGFRAFWQRKNLDGLEDENAAMAMQSLQLGSGANFLGPGY
jgi:DNA-binding transcriptional MocR family regulator